MNIESKQKHALMKVAIDKAADCLKRACDGATAHNWDCLTLGYTQNQLLRANRAIIDAIVAINDEVNGRREGEPADTLPDEVVEDSRHN